MLASFQKIAMAHFNTLVLLYHFNNATFGRVNSTYGRKLKIN